jgi:putative redox protein
MSNPSPQATLEWGAGLRFNAAVGPHTFVLDGERKAGCSPTEALMLSLAGCMAIDVVDILSKMGTAPRAVRAEISGTRADNPPRRFTQLALHFEIAGAGIAQAQAERAIALSREKYCSVWHSLRQDIELKVTYHLEKQP